MGNKETNKHLSDQELLHLCKASGNNMYLGLLLERYSLMLFGVCMKYLKDEEEAKDAVQHVYTKAIVELRKYHVEYLKSWLYMIARNYCLMQLRSKSQHYNIAADINEVADETVDWQIKQATADTHALLQLTEQGLMQLPEQQNKCITLFYLSKKSYQQICELTGYSLMQVKSHIQNGKRNIRLWVEKQLKHHA